VDPAGDDAPAGTLDSFAEQWLRHPTGRVQPGSLTHDEYVRQYSKRIAPLFGSMPLDELTPSLLQSWANRLRDEGLALSTIKHVTGTLARILADAQAST
jgi:hypothetical protein